MNPPAFDYFSARHENASRTHVYFIEGAGLVKIGSARSPIDRFYSLLTGSPVPLSLLASMPGGSAKENELHRQFSDDRSHGEWFRRSPALDAIIESAPYQYGPDFRDQLTSLAKKVGELARTRRAA